MAFGETDLLANLRYGIPARLLDGRRDELGADVAFAEVFFIHGEFLALRFVNKKALLRSAIHRAYHISYVFPLFLVPFSNELKEPLSMINVNDLMD